MGRTTELTKDHIRKKYNEIKVELFKSSKYYEYSCTLVDIFQSGDMNLVHYWKKGEGCVKIDNNGAYLLDNIHAYINDINMTKNNHILQYR